MVITRRDAINLLLILLSVPTQYFILSYSTLIKQQALEVANSTWEQFQYLYNYVTATTETEEKEIISKNENENAPVIDENEIRKSRPDNLKYHIGQAVIHADHGYIGVIIGWDASDEPIYHVLINYLNTPRVINANQGSLILLDFGQVFLVDLDKYFESFDGVEYKPKAWLRTLYPVD